MQFPQWKQAMAGGPSLVERRISSKANDAVVKERRHCHFPCMVVVSSGVVLKSRRVVS